MLGLGCHPSRYTHIFPPIIKLFSPLSLLMASLSSFLLILLLFSSPFLIEATTITASPSASRRHLFTSIFSFGDSLTDTGNYILTDNASHLGRLPYGETYFHHPTGRASNGRLVVDFIAEALGIPLLPPYLGHKNEDCRKGVNFAVNGATALDASFFENRGIHFETKSSLGVQLLWFRQLLPSLCGFPSNCEEFFKNSLFLVGEIGGNDYNHPFFQKRRAEEVRSFAPKVVQAISSAVNTLIGYGAVMLFVPGNMPIGCLAAYLTLYSSNNKGDYEPTSGCLTWLNNFSKYHNNLLQKELHRLQVLHPHVTIVYGDYYNAAMDLYRSPNQLGFSNGALTACCGGGGPYNYNASAWCGDRGSTVCEDPSSYVGWDGKHLTEAAYKWVADFLLQDPLVIPNDIDISGVSL